MVISIMLKLPFGHVLCYPYLIFNPGFVLLTFPVLIPRGLLYTLLGAPSVVRWDSLLAAAVIRCYGDWRSASCYGDWRRTRCYEDWRWTRCYGDSSLTRC
jgi:hypothetical protein